MSPLHQGVAVLLLRRLALGFAGWQAAYWGERSSTAMERAGRRLVHRGLSRGWQAWVDKWRGESATAIAMRKVLTAWLHRRVSRGWRGW